MPGLVPGIFLLGGRNVFQLARAMKINLPLLQVVFLGSYLLGTYFTWRFGPRLPGSRSIREFIHRYAFAWYDPDIDPVLGQRWRNWQQRVGLFTVVMTVIAAVISHRFAI
jgi:hypothetical protein